MDAIPDAAVTSAEPTFWFAGSITYGPSWDAGHLARVRGQARKLPPDEIDPEKWLAGYDSPLTDFDGAPPMPDEDAGGDAAHAGLEGGLLEPVTPSWASVIHPRSLIAPQFVTEDLEAEQLLEVWRHSGLLTVVGKPSFEGDDVASVMVHLLEGVVCHVEGWGRIRPRKFDRQMVVEGAWSTTLRNHLRRVQAVVGDRSSRATAHAAAEAAPVPRVPSWADELHPRSLVAPAYVLGDHLAEQVLEVWRHRDLLTIVGKPRFDANPDVAFMVHQLDTQIRFMDSSRNRSLRDDSCPMLAKAVWAGDCHDLT